MKEKLTIVKVGGAVVEDEAQLSQLLKDFSAIEGKKVLVWTANEKEVQRHFLCTDADGIITDNVSQAVRISEELEKRSDLDRMVDKIKTVL